MRRLYREWQGSLDDPEPTQDAPRAALLDEDPGADEAFARDIARVTGLPAPSTPNPTKKGRAP